MQHHAPGALSHQYQYQAMRPQPRSSMRVEVGTWMSLVSRSELRYEGQLVAINREQSTVELSSVRCLGDEGRRQSDGAVRPSDQIFERIVFRSQDIKDLHVLRGLPPGLTPDPAIVAYQIGDGGRAPVPEAPPARASRGETADGRASPAAPAPPAAPAQARPEKHGLGDGGGRKGAAPAAAAAAAGGGGGAPERKAAPAWSTPTDSLRSVTGGGAGAGAGGSAGSATQGKDWLGQAGSRENGGGRSVRPLQVEKLAEATGSVLQKSPNGSKRALLKKKGGKGALI